MHAYDIVAERARGRSTPGRRGARRRRSTRAAARRTTVARTLVTNDALKARLAALKQGPAEFFQVDIGDGIKLDAWMMKPADFDSTKKYPVLFYVYGEPAAQTVLDAYGGSTLALAPDAHAAGLHRGERGQPRHAGPEGRDWRKAVLNQIGALRVQRAVGGGAGHRAACRTSTRRASACGAGAAADRPRCCSCSARPTCTGWAWRSRRWPTCTTTTRSIRSATSDCPRTDSAAYHDASADQLRRTGSRGDLLVVHGSGDDNVHYQGTEQLINALVAANKPFSMMEYPNRTHGIYEGRGHDACTSSTC